MDDAGDDLGAAELVVPHDRLSPEALRGVIDDFITRGDVEAGHAEYSLDEKRAQVMSQLRDGTVVVRFDAGTQTCTLARIL